MPKGIFTQGICVLLDRPVSLEDIEAALSEFEILGRRDALESWAFGGPTLIISYLPEANGLVAVDTVDQPWPDHMGSAEDEPLIFGAWSMGHFGPFAFPGGLERAAQQCWTWEDAASIPERHRAFVRIRSSYVFGAGEDATIMPDDYEPLAELEFVTRLASALLKLPGALCYFNPNGEILSDDDGLRENLNHAWAHDLPALDVWSNVRIFNINSEWSLMDTVGNSQLDLPDLEACFHTDSYDLNEVGSSLRNASLYLLRNGEVIKDGDTLDGPGEIRWQARHFDDGLSTPPRHVIRMFPLDDRPVPDEALQEGQPED